MKKIIMAILVLTIMCVGCTSKSSTGDNKKETSETIETSENIEASEGQTGYPEGEVQSMYVYLNSGLYKYTGRSITDAKETYITDKEYYKLYGQVQKEDNKNIPTTELCASRFTKGCNVYTNKENNKEVVIYMEDRVYYLELEDK